jgi:hypothetical protein
VASGLMIEKVRSIAIGLVFKEENAGEPFAAAYSDRAVARQGVTKALAMQAQPCGTSQTATRGDAPAPMGQKTPASRKLIRGPSFARGFCALFYRDAIEPDGSLARLTGRM